MALNDCKMLLNDCRMALNDCRLILNNCNLTLKQCKLTLNQCKMFLNDCEMALNDCRQALNELILLLLGCKLVFWNCAAGKYEAELDEGAIILSKLLRHCEREMHGGSLCYVVSLCLFVSIKCLLPVHSVIQFRYPAGKLMNRYQVELYFFMDACKQRNALPQNDGINKQPVAVN